MASESWCTVIENSFGYMGHKVEGAPEFCSVRFFAPSSKLPDFRLWFYNRTSVERLRDALTAFLEANP